MIESHKNASGTSAATAPRVTTPNAVPKRPGAIMRETKPFYELDRWSKYNDPLMVIGYLFVCAGFAMFCPPVAVILFGSGLCGLSWMMGR